MAGRLGNLALALGILCLCVTTGLPAQEQPGFARVDIDETGRPRALQMAVATYLPADGAPGPRVDLVSAVHIGEAAYYAELNRRFGEYDAVLYELVAPPGTVLTPETEKTGFIAGAQQLLTRALDLTFQLDEIDYTQPNLVHADLSGDELARSMAERDESLYTYFWRMVFATFREYAKDPLGLRDIQNLTAVVGAGGTPSFKTLLAYEIANPGSLEPIFGDDAESSIIGVRNARAIEVLGELTDEGIASAAIFYGVGHMPDLEERLLEKGFVRGSTVWIDAWHLDAE